MTKFTFTLPIAEQKEKNIKILYIEDDKGSAELMTKILKKFRYDVKICINGEEGIIELENKKYDILITDLNLPDVDGENIIKFCIDHKINIPIIVLTADSHLERMKKIHELYNINTYLTKPFSIKKLMSIIEEILNKN